MLQQFFGKRREPTPDLGPWHRLEALRKRHEFIDVTLRRSGKRYQSMILAIDPDTEELSLDALFPAEGMAGLQAGDGVEVGCQHRQLAVRFSSRVLGCDPERLTLELPAEIGNNSQQGAFRVYVDGESELQLELGAQVDEACNDSRMLTSDDELQSHIVNLSSEAIKLRFDRDISELLQTGCRFDNALLRLPDGDDIDCQLQLQRLYFLNKPQPHSLACGSITISLPQQRVKLSQYLASIQRKQRRRESRAD